VDPDLSVVIPTHQRPEKLRRALDRLESQRRAPDFESIVVANPGADTAPVVDAIGEREVQPRFLVAGSPGASAARNLGWREARAPLVLFLGDDILASEELLHEHVSWHGSHPEETVGVLGHVRWARGLKVTPFMRWLEQGMQFDYGAIRGNEADAGRLYTANVSLKRDMLARAGGFDESLPFLFEDTELGYRLWRLGFRLLYNRRADAEHLHESTLDDWRKRMRITGGAEYRLVRQHPELNAEIHERMVAATSRQSRGRAARFVRVVPPGFPVLGRVVWTSAEQRWLKELAPPFLEGWEEAAAEEAAVAVAR
jgi:GT2 family glycosyltransferase